MTQDFSDARQHAPATQRNRRPILEVLRQHIPTPGVVLEIASGTGEHACFFANHLPHCQWLPSDTNELSLRSIEAWRRQIDLPNLYPPILLDVTQAPWSIEQENAPIPAPPLEPDPALSTTQIRPNIRAIVNINMIHISPWSACEGLFAGAGRLLPEGGVLYLYGPFKRDGQHTAPSNAAFDQSLRSRNAEWGVRDLDVVTAVAQSQGFLRQDVIPMPANNLSVIFIKS